MDIRIDQPRGRRIRVYANGRFVAAYTLGQVRPYVYPVLTPSGLPVTEECPVDHPHHQSVWLGQDEVNGHNLWINGAGAGRVAGGAPVAVVGETPDGPAAIFRHELLWEAPDGTPLLRERRVTAITPAPAATLIDVVSERSPAAGPVVLGATKEAGFGLRVHDALDEQDGGTLVNDRGRQGEAGTFDQEADWIDYWGHLGDCAAGIALFPHPENPRHPWFTRAYGIVLANHNRFRSDTLEPGQVLRLRWRVAAHDGSTEAADVAGLYAGYLQAGRGGLDRALALRE
ncbi:MAG: PmoA family protein [Chloroflexi bacterium]|nr:PmoA family protein [Chloroflexota bacterium]